MPSAALLTVVACAACAPTIPPDQDPIPVDGDSLCSDCAAGAVYCAECSERTRDPHLTVADTELCAECVRRWSRCDECHLYARYITAIIGGPDVCEDCAEQYPVCDDCDNRCQGTDEVEGGNEVCSDCRRDDYRECDDCYTLIPSIEDYCASCALDHPCHDGIHSYDYKPEPHFHGRGPLFLGLELELKTPNNSLVEAAETALEELGDLGYLKTDSSIHGSGFELVAHSLCSPFHARVQ
jgi:hypothetical protein